MHNLYTKRSTYRKYLLNMHETTIAFNWICITIGYIIKTT